MAEFRRDIAGTRAKVCSNLGSYCNHDFNLKAFTTESTGRDDDKMNLISVGKVKAWQLNANSGIIGVCIPKVAQENLHVEKGTSFDVKIDMNKRKIILEPISTEATKETKQVASSAKGSRRTKAL